MGPITSLYDLKTALRRQFGLIALGLALGLPAVYWYVKTRPSIYEAEGILGIEVPQGQLADSTVGPGVTRRLDEVEQALMSRESLLALAEEFSLFAEETEAGRVRLVRDSISITRLVDAAQAWNPQVLPYAISVAVQLEDSEEAAAVANALIDQAVEEDEERVRADITSSLERQRLVLDYLVQEETRVVEQIAQTEAELAQLRGEFADSLPEVLEDQRERLVTVREQLEELESQLEGFDANQSSLSPDLAARRREQLAEQRATLQAEIDELEAAIAAAPEVEQSIAALTRRSRTLEAELTAISGQRTQAELGQQVGEYDQVARLYELEAAAAPDIPISSSKANLALAGGVAVLVLTLGVALAREILHPGIRNTAQMKAQLGVEPVVVIPYVRAPNSTWRWAALSAAFVALVFLVMLAQRSL
jgi:uncharacterized protein involved in exopolysaccharide biosynthesis